MNALGAVAGAGVNVILGVFDVDFFGVDFFDDTIGEDGRIDTNDNGRRAVGGNIACGFDMVVGLEHGPERDVVDVFGVAIAARAVVPAAFGARGTI